jgi:nucleotide-binding universal stress UspA family protein
VSAAPASEAVAEQQADPGFARILLATEGRNIPDSAIDRVVELADASGPARPRVRVLAIARVHGVAFAFPNPGLMPTRQELADRKDTVARAIKRLRRHGIDASGHVVGTRKATARIVEEAAREECQAIVMAADPDRNRFVADMMWSQEPQRVRRRARVPVFLVPDEG